MRSGLSVARAMGVSHLLALVCFVPWVRALAPRTQIDDAYDFVVVGGGLAGLVLGARLSEDTNHTVLVLEAGDNGDAYRQQIDTPADAYFNSITNTPLDWNFNTVEQPGASNRQINWPRGKTLGGSAAMNGLYLLRPGALEINAWRDLLGDMDGADSWSWDSLYAAMKKTENFTAPASDIADEAGITWDASDHGTQGPIQASYPGYTFPQVGQWLTALQNIGVPTTSAGYGGDNWGGQVSTSSINPSNWTRSYSRTGYLDPLPDRGNYDVLADAYVTRLLFNSSSPAGNRSVSAVEYTTDGGQTVLHVAVNKEVVLAAGSVGSPAVLLYSGVGPKDVLSSAGVELVSELPGVGQHLQDHFSATVKWDSSVVTAGSIWAQNGPDKTNPLYLSYINSATAYVNATSLYGDTVNDLQTSILNDMNSYAPNSTYDDGVIAGYKAIYNTTATTILESPTGQIELLLMNSDPNGDVGITAALQHPYSHGRVYINSSNPLDYPNIDPNYLANPTDWSILRDGLKLARRLGQTDPFKGSLDSETTPGPSVQTDEEWEDWLRQTASTEFHPSSSCAMLPREQGGVVDANLRVYGLANVRVADASVVPIAFSAHTMASTYGLAEQASTIIRNFYNGVTSTSRRYSSSSSASASASPSASPSTTSDPSTGTKSKATSGGMRSIPFDPVWWSLFAVVVHAGAFFTSLL